MALKVCSILVDEDYVGSMETPIERKLAGEPRARGIEPVTGFQQLQFRFGRGFELALGSGRQKDVASSAIHASSAHSRDRDIEILKNRKQRSSTALRKPVFSLCTFN